MKTYEIIKRPLVTEKGAIAAEAANQYFFEVELGASKQDVRNAVEKIFNVHVNNVRTLRMPAKYKRVGKNIGRTSEWKKAVVTLKEGERIEFLEGA